MDKVNRFSKVLDPVFQVIRWLTVILLTVMVVIGSLEISMRTFSDYTPAWAKEVVLIAMVWMGCLGAAVLHRERGHITVEFLVDRYLPRLKRAVMIGVDFLILAFSCFIIYSGLAVSRELMGQVRPGTNLPVGLSYLPLAVTGGLLLLTSLEHILAGLRPGRGEDSHAA